MHGKNIAKTVLETTSCLAVKFNGPNKATATSLRKNPTNIATIASLGKPKSLVTTGAVIR